MYDLHTPCIATQDPESPSVPTQFQELQKKSQPAAPINNLDPNPAPLPGDYFKLCFNGSACNEAAAFEDYDDKLSFECMHVYICLLNIYTHTYIYIYRERERERESKIAIARERERESERSFAVEPGSCNRI